MPSLPLKVQVGIRDHWNKEDGPLRASLKSLRELLGHEIVVEPEWQLLLAELGDFYPDKTNFVGVAAGCVQTWAKSMTELLEDESNEQWTELLLEKTKSRSQLRLFLEASSSDKGSTSWSERRLGCVISLPKKQLFQPVELYPTFRGGLLDCFNEKQPEMPSRSAGAGDDWADVEMDSTTGKAAIIEKPVLTTPVPVATYEPVASDFLPSVASLPRPDELLSRPPYHLVMHATEREIEVQCSHSPTLQLLADYLKRWCRVNHSDTRAPPAVEVKLHQSAFGLGEMFDRLELNTKENRYIAQFQVTSPIILALIEGVMGYKLVSTHGGTWSFRREVEFKTF